MTLLLRLEGPMQSWGTQSRFPNRDTGLEPSKSGVIGLLCAAMGRPRSAPLTDLAALRMGVRVDNPGIVRKDYHTAGGGYPRLNARGVRVGELSATLSDRFFLAGASFAVGLAGDEVTLHACRVALARPVWQLFLGRKSFVPSQPVLLHVSDDDLEDSLRTAPLTELGHQHVSRLNGPRILRFVLDSPEGDETRLDVPISFADRTFAGRRVAVTMREVAS